VDLFLKDRVDEGGNPIKFNYEAVSDRWEIAVCPSENNFQQNSFVNSIATTKVSLWCSALGCTLD
jgi:DNA topoisomerase-2